ncbi:MAG: hypothetical protein IJA48_06785 [Oscillospiraceae bacterium]|nr:hypothetical protein [Oscillospiraceae bacterium]
MPNYDDIIHTKAPIPLRHGRMPVEDRAAQFAPFAALTGYEAAVEEAGRQTRSKVELDENEKALLDRKLRYLKSRLADPPPVRICCFVPDLRKAGGSYCELEGYVVRFEQLPPGLRLSTGDFLPLDDIVGIELPERKEENE